MKKLKALNKLLRSSDYSTNIKIYFSSKAGGDFYDPYEDNYTRTNLNPIVIKAYVTDVSPEALVYKQYGLHEQGAKQIITESRYRNYFENANKIEIDSKEYQVYREGTGNRTLITTRPFNMIRVVVSLKG